jgi:hypothetical protein
MEFGIPINGFCGILEKHVSEQVLALEFGFPVFLTLTLTVHRSEFGRIQTRLD